jgi:hypothetical protein
MSVIFNTAKRDFANGTHDWDDLAQLFKVLLLDASYVPNPDHVFVSDLVAFEVSGPGYTGGFGGAGRKSLTTRTVVANLTADRAELDADDISIATLTVGVVGGAVVFRERTSDADSEIIAFIDSGFPVTTAGLDFGIAWNSGGVLQIT